MNIETNQQPSFKKKYFKHLSPENLVYSADIYDGAQFFQKAFVNDDYCGLAGAKQHIKENIHVKLDIEDEEKIKSVMARTNNTRIWCGEIIEHQQALARLNTALVFGDDLESLLERFEKTYEALKNHIVEEAAGVKKI